jgi:hypothetical protein
VTTQENSQQNGSGKLNVIFHGAFTFIDTKEQNFPIKALMPNISHHVHRAGTWLAETDLRGGEYQLQVVEPGRAEFDQSQNLILKNGKLSGKLGREIYAKLHLPRPDKISSLRILKVPFDGFDKTQAAALRFDPKKDVNLATLQVFTYRFKSDNNLTLTTPGEGSGHYWEPAFIGDYINLHIFSTEDHYDTPSNAARDFRDCARLLGVELELEYPQPVSGIPNNELLPTGVIAEETEDLALRMLRLARLGRLVSQKSDANMAWYGNDALDSNPSACPELVGIHR